MNVPNNVMSVSGNVSGPEVISSTVVVTACNALVNVPSNRAGTPKPPSWPGSALAQCLPHEGAEIYRGFIFEQALIIKSYVDFNSQ